MPASSVIVRGATLAALVLVCGLAAGGRGALASQDDVIGAPRVYRALATMGLLDVARANGLGYVETVAANPGIDPQPDGTSRMVALPTQHVLPDAPRRGIVVNLPEMRLYYFPPAGPVRSFAIGVGKLGKETPSGHTQITRKAAYPVWVPTPSERAEDHTLPARVGPGPANQLGDRALYLGWDEYAIHGTNNSDSIGRHDSHGCIKLYPDDIATLFEIVPVGTPVLVVNQPVKVGWLADELYLQVHPDIADADAIAANGRTAAGSAVDADGMVVQAAGKDAARLDWTAIHRAEQERSGLATRVTRTQ
jgi:L,D-transpeptidase ErfK/SrfK